MATETTKAPAVLTPEQKAYQELNRFLTQGQSSIAKALPVTLARYLTPERMIRLTMNACIKNPRLLQCQPMSVASAVIEAAQLGLECDGVLGQGYLIPRWSKKLGAYAAHFQIGYKGLIALSRRGDDVESVASEAVYEGDEFKYQKGLNDELLHIPRATVMNKDTLTYAWALIRFKSGGYQFKVLNKQQVEMHRLRSESPDSGPWSTDYGAMACAAALRMLFKLCDLSPEVARKIVKEENPDEEPGDDLPPPAGLLGPAEPPKAPAPPPPGSQPDAREAPLMPQVLPPEAKPGQAPAAPQSKTDQVAGQVAQAAASRRKRAPVAPPVPPAEGSPANSNGAGQPTGSASPI